MRLINKEIRLHILSYRYMVLLAVSTVGIWSCLYDGHAAYVERLSEYRAAQAATEARLGEIRGNPDFAEILGNGYPVNRPPVILSIFARGLEPVLGRSASTGWKDISIRMRASPASVDPDFGAILPMDLGLFAEIVLGLLALLLTYDAVCGEKQEGTLRLAASYPVSRAVLLLSKTIGAAAAVAVAFWLPFLTGLSALLMSPSVTFGTDELLRSSLVGVSFTAFFLLFVCAGLLGSALTHRPSTAFVILLSYWALTVIVLPKASLMAADLVHPAPSVHQLRAGREASHRESVRIKGDRWGAWAEAFEKSHDGKSWRDVPGGNEAMVLYSHGARDDQLAIEQAANDKLESEFWNRYNARADFARTVADFSPAFALRNSLALICGTGIDRDRRFEKRLTAHRTEWQTWLRVEYVKAQLAGVNAEKYGEFVWDASDLPSFVWNEAWPDEEVREALFQIGVLAGWSLLFFSAAFVAMVRYDPR